MITDEIARAIRTRYSKVHPLIFQRSLDHARNDAELFDILDTLPTGLPIVWSESDRRWIKESDMFLTRKFQVAGDE